eukprot:XP_001692748.1 predicted protein [Chlamydomonas reinhardtii]
MQKLHRAWSIWSKFLTTLRRHTGRQKLAAAQSLKNFTEVTSRRSRARSFLAALGHVGHGAGARLTSQSDQLQQLQQPRSGSAGARAPVGLMAPPPRPRRQTDMAHQQHTGGAPHAGAQNLSAAEPYPPALEPQSLALLAWSTARLGLAPGGEWPLLDRLVAIPQAELLSTSDLALSLYSLGRLLQAHTAARQEAWVAETQNRALRLRQQQQQAAGAGCEKRFRSAGPAVGKGASKVQQARPAADGACQHSRRARYLRRALPVLLQAGFDPNTPDAKGRTAPATEAELCEARAAEHEFGTRYFGCRLSCLPHSYLEWMCAGHVQFWDLSQPSKRLLLRRLEVLGRLRYDTETGRVEVAH